MKNTQIQQLKSDAHALKPVVQIGSNGLTENVKMEAEHALLAHELIKVKVAGMERDERQACAQDLSQALGAVLIQSIGNVIVLYRKKPKSV